MDKIWNPFIKAHQKITNLIILPPFRKFESFVADVQGMEEGSSWNEMIPMDSHVSENHISPDPINYLTKVEVWDTLV